MWLTDLPKSGGAMAPPLQPQGRQVCTTTIQSRLVSGARAGCKVMINATYGRKMQPAMHAAARRRALIAPRRRATSFISRAVSYFDETEFEIWATFGWVFWVGWAVLSLCFSCTFYY